jgi:hypothetical protein
MVKLNTMVKLNPLNPVLEEDVSEETSEEKS